MKYLILKVQLGSANVPRHIPIIFPDLLVHKLVFDNTKMMLLREHNAQSVEAYSGGFVNSMDLDVSCHGESESLGVKAKEGDADIIRSFDYRHGVMT